MKIYSVEDKERARITSAKDEALWYSDRIGRLFKLSRTSDEWDHIKVLVGGDEYEVLHGDYKIIGARISHKWSQVEGSLLKCDNCNETTEYTGATFDPLEGTCIYPKQNYPKPMVKTRYYVDDKCIWTAESPDMPDKMLIMHTILYLLSNNYGEVTRFEVNLKP